MTTEPIQDTAPVEESPPPIDRPEANPIIGEIDRLNQEERGEVDQPDDTDGAPAEEAQASQPVAEQGVEGSSEAPPSEPTAEPSPQPGFTPQQLQQMQFQAQQYEEQQRQASLQSQAQQYQGQLESQGYSPEQAEFAAREYMQSQQRQVDLMKQAEEYNKYVQGQMIAAEHFVKQYKLNVEDLSRLRTYNDPESMENAAKELSSNRERDAELTKLRQAQVPAQQFDNSQGEPSVASNENGWLDRYNSGDRSPNSVAAARRAVGLE